MHETKARVESIDVISEKYRRMTLQVGWQEWTPGQFVMVHVPCGSIIVRRPFGIVGIEDGVLELCFKLVGPGTNALAHVKVGDDVEVLGPLGRGFDELKGTAHVLVAGGYGIAPIFGLARKLAAEGRKPVIAYGAKAAADLLYRHELNSLGCDLHFFTEDGSVGEKGMVTDTLASLLASLDEPLLYACGPKGLLQAVAAMGLEGGTPTQVSLDEYMACGIGVCLGCMCEMNDGTRQRACREGPVFNARDVKW